MILNAQPRIARYFYRLRDCNLITEVCVAGSCDPSQFIATYTADGTLQKWDQRTEGELLVFHAPDGYDGGGFIWSYNERLQKVEAMPRAELESLALRCRKSTIVNTG